MLRITCSFLVGLILAVGVALLLQAGFGRASASRAEGTITEIRHDVSDTGRIHWPYFVFNDTQGRAHTVRFAVGVGDAEAYVVGQKVPVLYRAEAPERAMVDDPIQFWLKPALVVVVGLVGVWVLWLSRARGDQ